MNHETKLALSTNLCGGILCVDAESFGIESMFENLWIFYERNRLGGNERIVDLSRADSFIHDDSV